jgi:hypothetical protein
MFGLSLAQLTVCALGVIVGVMVMSLVSSLAGVVVMTVAGVLGVVKIGDQSLLGAIPNGIRWIRTTLAGPVEWYAPIPLVGGDPNQPAPRPLADHDLLIVDAATVGAGPPGAQIAISRDRQANTYAATVRVTGRQFALVDRSEQDHLIDQWGIALQGFIAERTPVVSIRWTEWAAPAGLDEHRHWVNQHLADNPLDNVRTAYERLLQTATTTATRHETLVTITINPGRIPRRRRNQHDQTRAAVDALLTEIRLLTQRLEAADLTVSPPLIPAEWARAIRLRLDPTSRTTLDTRAQTLGDTAGAVDPANATPLAAVAHWTAWQTDNMWHRALYVSEWPRLDVGGPWLGELMVYNGAVRSVTVFFEPVPRSRSRRAITRDAAKIHSDAEHRAEKGFRIGAQHRRAARAVEEREEELVAGYGELAYAGIVTITAPSEDDLDDATDEITQVAASVGIELRPLHGRHDHAVCTALPIARGLTPTQHL